MSQGKRVKVDTPFKDAWFKPWGGKKDAKPQHTNKGSKK